MSAELQTRAKAFLERPIPAGIDYVPNSLSERFVLTYANLGTINLDQEYSELLDLCIIYAIKASKTSGGDEAAFFSESALILEAIQSELLPDYRRTKLAMTIANE